MISRAADLPPFGEYARISWDAEGPPPPPHLPSTFRQSDDSHEARRTTWQNKSMNAHSSRTNSSRPGPRPGAPARRS
ncbi:hypothetical protein ACFFX0_13350 [Citricoccus parietis]|uniref:Uncharacterized protein n=1 Tax=Citricoccus parietis TaxID=592307 RepID=A0ABV5FZL4_9MICC